MRIFPAYWFILLCMILPCVAGAQQFQGFAFNRITTGDGTGLGSNVVLSIYQDPRGYIWAGTANGLQRFDGGKFMYLRSGSQETDKMPHAPVRQIISLDSNHLLLYFHTIREIGIFNSSDFTYHQIKIQSDQSIPPRSEFQLWKTGRGEIFLNISRFGIFRLVISRLSFVDETPRLLPKGWLPGHLGGFDEVTHNRIWFACDSGLAVYDRQSKQSWHRNFNPAKLALLQNDRVQDGVTTIYIDQQKRYWLVGWPSWGSGQQIYCLDSTGSQYLNTDTIGLHTGPVGYTEFHHFFETRNGTMWMYGSGILFNYNRAQQQFDFIPTGTQQIGISYEVINQLMEDRDGNIWFATDQGLYYTPLGNDAYALINLIFGNKKEIVSITDILELPNEDIWFSSWGNGIKAIDKFLRPKVIPVYNQSPPSSWTAEQQRNVRLTWSLCRERLTGKIWIGCNGGVLLRYDPLTEKTEYLLPEACGGSTIRFIAEDRAGRMWLGTQSGKLVCYEDDQFLLIQDIGTIIYKIFVDKQGWLWLATHEKGLYAIHPVSGLVIQHYTAGPGINKLYGNTGMDIEQLNDSLIVYGAGVLNLVNKWTGRVSWVSYEDGLPSNNISRLRMDKKGFLWIITTNGLCRFNPLNYHITPYGRKDGILIAEQTNTADFVCRNGLMVFGGSNNALIFDPEIFSNTQPPANVSITDFKIFNQYFPVDSLLELPSIKLGHSQNSISIYFSCLSFKDRDKLTYYYKMEGVDKNWIKADQGYFAHYSLLPPGKYTFNVYCENLEGIRSPGITRFELIIRPPFWRTGWFISSLILLVLLIIYDLHNARVKRLLAVEKLRNKLARDLHDDMGSTLSTINILASMAKTKMNSDAVKTSEYLGKISENSQRMMEAMDDIVWSIKPSNDNMQRITSRMREFATQVLEAKGIELDFKVADDVQDARLNMEMRRDFFLVFKEAINNAAKYSRANRVSVDVSIRQRRIILRVKDDGVGFDMLAKPGGIFGGNGMGNMKKRAESMNGTISVNAAPEKGTEVILRVPVR